MSTFGAMRETIADELGDPDDSRWTSEIEAAIVQAIKDYEDETFWFSQDKYVTASDVTSLTTSGQEHQAFPTSPDLIRLDSLRIKPSGTTDPYPLIRDHWDGIEAIATLAAVSTGTPARYAVRGEKVRLYPIPDSDSHTLYWAGLFRPTTVIAAGAGNSQTNVWMTEGAVLIRNRAKKQVARDKLKDAAATLAAQVAEDEALDVLKRKTERLLGTGRNRAVGPGQRRSGRR